MSSLIIGKYRKGYKFYCPISKSFYGPYFKTKDSIEEFLNWYDGDVRYIGSWLSQNKQWSDLVLEWLNSEMGKHFKNDIITNQYHKKSELLLLDVSV